ncbi:hypothetical protein HGRIS_004795 [Hohenbuehelia grisea]|uniref:Cytochrome P450 n=1 Tax=Hohenbuehelia grisea TaxID=104357 RepID=A0ABR3JDL5_9AGAR
MRVRQLGILMYAFTRPRLTDLEAGGDISVSPLMSFVLAMALHPHVVARAHEELDHVLGGSRLPTFEDRSALPYIDAVYREVLRWRPVLPLSVGRCALDHDVYNGYLIPKGAAILTNIWAMAHDETKYPQPSVFRPERFLTTDGQLEASGRIFAFGFGRRICAGRAMADATIWLTIASMLAVFNITKAKDQAGKEIPIPEYDYTDGLISHPKPFQYSIHPRSLASERLINEII